MMNTGWLFPDPAQLHRLERLTIAAKGRVRGTMQGKRRSRLLGSSLEFADYRPYAPGDDIRRLDWNVYGRTGKAFIRQYWDEQELSLRLYVDASPSMRFGLVPGSMDGGAAIPAPENKLACALRLAACIGYVALSGEDRVSACVFADRVVSSLPTVRGKGAALRLFDYLASEISRTDEECPGTDDMRLPFSVSGVYPRLPGQCWLFTDGLYERGIEQVLDGLAASGQHAVVVQVLSPQELSPGLVGELKLIDSETGTAKEVAIGKGVKEAYQAALQAHIAALRRLCAERGFGHVLADSSEPAVDRAIRILLGDG